MQDLVRRQRAAVASKTCRAAAMADANGILSVLKAWNGSCGADEVFSLGVLCPGKISSITVRLDTNLKFPTAALTMEITLKCILIFDVLFLP